MDGLLLPMVNAYQNKELSKYLKSHKENGFEEPIYAFVPSIGISELIIVTKFV